jgi:hypothetical protein
MKASYFLIIRDSPTDGDPIITRPFSSLTAVKTYASSNYDAEPGFVFTIISIDEHGIAKHQLSFAAPAALDFNWS